MNSKLCNLVAAILVACALIVTPVAVYAQDATPPATIDPSAIPNLPNDLVNETPDKDTKTDTANTTPLTQREDFIAGVGVGIVFGIIVGGVIVWFTKKS